MSEDTTGSRAADDDTQALATHSPPSAPAAPAPPSPAPPPPDRGPDAGRGAEGPRYGGPGADRGGAGATDRDRAADRVSDRSAATAAVGGAPTTVLPGAAGRPTRPGPARTDSRPGAARTPTRSTGRRRARLVVQRVDPWSVFLFSLVMSICLGVVLLAAVAALYAALSALGVLSSLNGVLGEVAGTGAPDEVVEPFITSGRVLSATAVLAAVDVVLLTALATLGALLYNLCASLTGGIEVQLGERD